jgi:hypothetical protein
MAGVIALLRALMRAQRRHLRSFFSIALNNFFVLPVLVLLGGISSLLMAGKHPLGSSAPLFLALGIITILPLSADPMSRVPSSRFELWPFDRGQRIWLRLAILILNPALWLAILLLLVKVGTLGAFLFLLFGMAAQALCILGTYLVGLVPPLTPSLYLPRLPSRFGGISTLTIKQITSSLDFYLGLLLSLGGWISRWSSPHADPDARPLQAMLVALALSTYTQAAFGMDSSSTISRYRLLPLEGWQIILAKDLGYLAVLALLLLPLDLASGLTFGMIAIIVGRYPSLRLARKQVRWRFTSGDLRVGACQILLGFALGLAAVRVSLWFLVGTALLYTASILWGGWLWDSEGVRI